MSSIVEIDVMVAVIVAPSEAAATIEEVAELVATIEEVV